MVGIGCWCPGNKRSLVISSHGIDLVQPEYSGFSLFWRYGTSEELSACCALSCSLLTHWCWMTHICISKIIIIGSDNGLSPSHYLNQCWNIVNWNIGNKLQWNCNRNQYIFIPEMHLKMSFVKWLPTYLSLNVLNGLGMGTNVLWTLEACRIVPWSEIQHEPMAHSGGRLNIKMTSYQYRDPHVHDRLIFNMGIPIPGKDGLYSKTGPRFSCKT